MDARLTLAVVLTACTSLESGDDRLDGGELDADVRDSGVDVFDAFDAFDACADPPIGECPPLCMRPRVTAGRLLSGVGHVVSNDETWSCDNIWVLEDDTYVESATLTIEPGTLVEAMPGASLVVVDDARLVVRGERDAPVVIRPPTTYEPGDEWRGLYLLGDAPVLANDGSPEIRDVNRLHPGRSEHGGSDGANDCGSLRYLRLEFAGRTRDDTEAEALFLGGCGSDTLIDYVQVHESADDAIVMHGGGFDVRHVIVTTGDRDALQWERGWNGTVQFYVAHMPVASEHAVVQAEGPVAGGAPPSGGVVANMTTVATSTGRAVIVEGSSLLIGNSIAVQRELFLRVRDAHIAEWGLGDIEVRNSVLFTETLPFFEQAGLESLYAPPNNGNSAFEPMLPVTGTDPILRSGASWRPLGDSPALTTSGTLPESVEPTDYAGAIDPDPEAEDWTEGWTFYLSRL